MQKLCVGSDTEMKLFIPSFGPFLGVACVCVFKQLSFDGTNGTCEFVTQFWGIFRRSLRSGFHLALSVIDHMNVDPVFESVAIRASVGSILIRVKRSTLVLLKQDLFVDIKLVVS